MILYTAPEVACVPLNATVTVPVSAAPPVNPESVMEEDLLVVTEAEAHTNVALLYDPTDSVAMFTAVPLVSP